MNTDRIYVVGGCQRPAEEIEGVGDWQHFQHAVVASLDLESGDLSRCVEYVSPPEACPEEQPSILFKAGTISDGRLYVCTQTEALCYSLATWEIERRISLPCFNDVHHVLPRPDDRLIVVSTGLDLLVEVDWEGRVYSEWSATDKSVWERFSREVDYRKIPSTKPHEAHPNFAFELDGELWATRASTGDARCVTAARTIERMSNVAVHDGIVRDGQVYFTSVDGHVHQADGPSGKIVRSFDLNAMVPGDAPLGWCRGVTFLGGGRAAVGFSRFRRTRWKENVRWLRHALGGDGAGVRPSRVGVFDLERGVQISEFDVESVGLNAVFSLHRV